MGDGEQHSGSIGISLSLSVPARQTYPTSRLHRDGRAKQCCRKDHLISALRFLGKLHSWWQWWWGRGGMCVEYSSIPRVGDATGASVLDDPRLSPRRIQGRQRRGRNFRIQMTTTQPIVDEKKEEMKSQCYVPRSSEPRNQSFDGDNVSWVKACSVGLQLSFVVVSKSAAETWFEVCRRALACSLIRGEYCRWLQLLNVMKQKASLLCSYPVRFPLCRAVPVESLRVRHPEIVRDVPLRGRKPRLSSHHGLNFSDLGSQGRA